MSLVAYASSEEESDAEEAAGEEEEEEEEAATAATAAASPPSQARGLFATLPPPKASATPALQPPGSAFPLLPSPPPFPTGSPPAPRAFGTSPPPSSPTRAEPAGGGTEEQQPRLGGLRLPPPRNSPAAASSTATITSSSSASPLGLPPPVSASGLDLSLPKAKKRTEPVRITVPELRKADSDSEEEEPTTKKISLQARPQGSGLSALLPQPKNLVAKEPNRLLLPAAFLRKAGESSPQARGPKSSAAGKAKASAKPPALTSSSSSTTTTPSPSAIKAAAKSAALQVTKQITQEEEEEEDSEEEVEPENYFSLPATEQPNLLAPEPCGYPGRVGTEDHPPGTEPEPPQFQDAAANAPLEFKTGAGGSGAQSSWLAKASQEYQGQYGQFPDYSEPAATGNYYQDYYSSSYYPEVEAAQAAPQEVAPDSSFLDDEAFKRLQGKRNRGREEINFVDIKGDDQLSGAQQWLTKSLTEEKTMKSFSKKKGDQPTGQQRRKHQITYLIHQAKERELELKNTWSENKLSRRQTQAKYGF